MSDANYSYSYTLYIDEAGDDHLTRVKPVDAVGGSDWLIISGILVRAAKEPDCDEWLSEIRSRIGSTQGRSLHFAKLSNTKQVAAAKCLGELPLRIFLLCSHKQNMRGHKNERAARVSQTKDFFYNYCCRLLLERATEYCAARGVKDPGNGKMKVVFSKKGGLSYGQMKAYWRKLYHQGVGRSEHLQKRRIDFDVLDINLADDKPFYTTPGLQLADIAASAAYQTLSQHSKNYPSEAAFKLLHRAAAIRNTPADCGVALQPQDILASTLTPAQIRFFEAAGFSFPDIAF